MQFDKRVHACFGVSPFNSYFSDDVLKNLVRWGKQHFKFIHFFVPDAPAAYTLEAIGYSPEEAAHKARRQGKYVQNKIHKALLSYGIPHFEAWEMIVDWKFLSQNQDYLSIYAQVEKLFNENQIFQNSCLEASRWVLERKVQDIESLDEKTLRTAVKYFLAEIPLFIDSASILGHEASVFCYHQTIPFLDGLYSKNLPLAVADNQGFIKLIPPTKETEAVSSVLLEGNL